MIRLGISNIAWRPDERAAIYRVLAEHGVTGLEIAPGLTFPEEADPFVPSNEAVSRFRDELGAAGLQLISMQSLLFGVRNASLFGSIAQRSAFEQGLARAVALAGRLGAPNLVMGSPVNRAIPETMSRTEAETIGCAAFRRLGDLAEQASTKLALEPNPAIYGTNFLTTISETIAFADLVDHPAVTVNFDLGALIANNDVDRAGEFFDRGRSRISHVHVSEPQLAPAPQDEAAFGRVAQELRALGYLGWYSIEMRQSGQCSIEAVENSVRSCARQLKKGAVA